jgi:hypothetical protein
VSVLGVVSRGWLFLNIWTYQQVEEAIAANRSFGKDLQVLGHGTRRQISIVKEPEDPFDDFLAESERVEDDGGHEAVQQAPAWDHPFVGLLASNKSALARKKSPFPSLDELTLETTATLAAPLSTANSIASTALAPPPTITTFFPLTSTLSNWLEWHV